MWINKGETLIRIPFGLCALKDPTSIHGGSILIVSFDALDETEGSSVDMLSPWSQSEEQLIKQITQ